MLSLIKHLNEMIQPDESKTAKYRPFQSGVPIPTGGRGYTSALFFQPAPAPAVAQSEELSNKKITQNQKQTELVTLRSAKNPKVQNRQEAIKQGQL